MSAAGQIGKVRAARFKLVALLASLGGLQASSALLAGLPANFETPVVLLQHGWRPGDDARYLSRLLQRHTGLPVRAALTGATTTEPGVTVVPHGKTAIFDRNHQLTLTDADRRGGGDAMFTSAAEIFGAELIAVVLTGMLCDGAEGIKAVKRYGGRVLAEDPATARAAGMPSAAIATGCVDFVLPLRRLSSALIALTMAPGAADMFTVPVPHWAQLDT
jgi:two-component system chemotaxis response regulator CheB